jgi:hypothetical protein
MAHDIMLLINGDWIAAYDELWHTAKKGLKFKDLLRIYNDVNILLKWRHLAMSEIRSRWDRRKKRLSLRKVGKIFLDENENALVRNLALKELVKRERKSVVKGGCCDTR